MSSTNRGAVRNLDDLYQTPEWVTHLLFQKIKIDGSILECAVGKGKMITVIKKYNKKVIGLDINKDFSPDICRDYLTYNPEVKWDNIITNPPFKYAIEFIKKSLGLVKDGGLVCMLLRLNFLESKIRYKFFKENMPKEIIVLSERPKFFNNKTDSICYAWFVWKKGENPEHSILRLFSKMVVSNIPFSKD